jgi:predicted RNase H-like nuclease
MAITDFEPNEAAAIVLDYKLSDSLNEGQIQISNDMLIDKISEEYPEIAMQSFISYQSTAFKAYNGNFQTKATVMEFSVMPSKEDATKN